MPYIYFKGSFDPYPQQAGGVVTPQGWQSDSATPRRSCAAKVSNEDVINKYVAPVQLAEGWQTFSGFPKKALAAVVSNLDVHNRYAVPTQLPNGWQENVVAVPKKDLWFLRQQAQLLFAPAASTSVVEYYYFTGSIQTWTCPSDVYSIYVECWGAGKNGVNGDAVSGGDGGSGGGYAAGTFSTTPGNGYDYRVGQSLPGSGQATSFNYDGVATFSIGANGASSSSPGSGILGTVLRTGGQGASTSGVGGGGGGSGANPAGSPNAGTSGGATGGAGGAGGTDFGAGGNGGNDSVNGTNGVLPGAGGGGGGKSASGGTGGYGQLRITYTIGGSPDSSTFIAGFPQFIPVPVRPPFLKMSDGLPINYYPIPTQLPNGWDTYPPVVPRRPQIAKQSEIDFNVAYSVPPQLPEGWQSYSAAPAKAATARITDQSIYVYFATPTQLSNGWEAYSSIAKDPKEPKTDPGLIYFPYLAPVPPGWDTYSSYPTDPKNAKSDDYNSLNRFDIPTQLPEGWQAHSQNPSKAATARKDEDRLYMTFVAPTQLPEGWQPHSSVPKKPATARKEEDRNYLRFAAPTQEKQGWEAYSAIPKDPKEPETDPGNIYPRIIVPLPEGWEAFSTIPKDPKEPRIDPGFIYPRIEDPDTWMGWTAYSSYPSDSKEPKTDPGYTYLRFETIAERSGWRTETGIKPSKPKSPQQDSSLLSVFVRPLQPIVGWEPTAGIVRARGPQTRTSNEFVPFVLLLTPLGWEAQPIQPTKAKGTQRGQALDVYVRFVSPSGWENYATPFTTKRLKQQSAENHLIQPAARIPTGWEQQQQGQQQIRKLLRAVESPLIVTPFRSVAWLFDQPTRVADKKKQQVWNTSWDFSLNVGVFTVPEYFSVDIVYGITDDSIYDVSGISIQDINP